MRHLFPLAILFLAFQVFANTVPSDEIFEPEDSVTLPLACYPDLENMCRSEGFQAQSRAFSEGFFQTTILAAADSLRAVVRVDSSVPQTSRLVLAGYSDDGSSLRAAFARIHLDGQLDTSFKTTGIGTIDFSANDDLIHGGYNLSYTSSIRFVGRTGNTSPTNYLVSSVLMTTGSLDTSFYTAGFRNGTFYGGSEILRAVQPGNNSTILVAGYTFTHPHYDFLVASFLSNGVLDTAFNTTGYRKDMLSSYDNGVLAVSQSTVAPFYLFPVLAGPVHNNSDWDFGVARYTTDGRLDTAFNTNGRKVVPVLSSNDKPYTVVVQEGPNHIVVGGYAYNGANNDFALVRLTSTGSLETSFNTTGIVTTDFFAADDVVFSIFVDPDYTKKTIVVGSANNGGNVDVAMARYQSSGGLDTAFHTDGKATFDIAGGKDVGVSIARESYYSTYTPFYFVGVQATVGGNLDFELLRVESDGTLAKNGEINRSFGTNGVISLDLGGGTDRLANFVFASNTRGGFANGDNGSDIVLISLLNRGVIATSFHTDGIQSFDLGGTELIEHGYTLFANSKTTVVGDNGSNFLLARFNNTDFSSSSALLDTSFYTTGSLTIDFSGNDKAYYTEEAVWVAGRDGATPSNFAVAKFFSDGTLNTSFNTDGKATYSPTGTAAIAKFISPNDLSNIFVAGENATDLVIIRVYETTGDLNTTFNTTGIKTVDCGGTDTFGGAYYDDRQRNVAIAGGNGSDFCIARMFTNGSLMTSFHTDGILSIDFGTTAEQAKSLLWGYGGRMIAVGDDGTNFLVARFTSNGILDTSFNTSGKQSIALTGNSTVYRATISNESGEICISGSTNANADAVLTCVHQ